MKYLLDTDHFSVLRATSGSERSALVGRMSRVAPEDLAVSVISFHEQVLGANTFISQAKGAAGLVLGYRMLGSIIDQFTKMMVLLFDKTSAEVFDDLGSRRIRVGTMDLRIASIALSRDLVLLTRNRRDFDRIPGLVTEDWTSPRRGDGNGRGTAGP